jgi:glycerophosphoryl diester phosphodiesterase
MTGIQRRTVLTGLGLAAGVTLSGVPAPASGARPRPIVIGHRGASGYRPEHTLESYRLAIELGADYIEPDLVSTKDGVLVARHENDISGTTDVADHPEFAGRRATKVVDGVSVTGWFTEDFTLAELRTLRAKERLPELRPLNTRYDGRYPIPTFQEIVDLARDCHRRVGIYPETKHPTYFRSIGLPLEGELVRVLRRNGLAHRDAPVFIQSFETANLRRLDRLVDVPLIQLLDATGRPYDFVRSGDPRTYRDLTRPANLRWIRSYADGVGVNKELVNQGPTLIHDAHATNLLVHAWTFRSENYFLPAEDRIGTDPAGHGDAAAEYRRFYGLGLDGVFSDFADAAVAARGRVPEPVGS